MKRIFKIISISVAAAVVVLTGWFFLKKQPVYDNYDEIQLFKVKRENLDNSIYISAIVVSDESEYVYSYVDAPVADVKVNKGDTVKKGDVICIFDCSELQTEYDNYKAILDHLENIDNIYSDTFNENSAIERNILESQIAQVKKLIENYQKKYDEVQAMEAEYRIMYEKAVSEQDELRSSIESREVSADNIEENKNVDLESSKAGENSNESWSDRGNNMETSDSDVNSIYDNINELYSLAAQKKEYAYEKQQEMKKNAEDIYDELNSYRRELDSLTIMYNDSSAFKERYFTPENLTEMINSYTDKLAELQNMIDKNVITATRDGIITDLYVTPNDYVSNNMICCIQNPDKVHFNAVLVPDDISDISLNSRIVVSMAANQYGESEGEILFISDCFDPQKNGYEINFTIDDIDEYNLYPGFEASAKIVIESETDTLIVPYDAIFDIDGQEYVRKYNESGEFEDIPVKKGLVTSYYVAVEASGLSENDLVATAMLN